MVAGMSFTTFYIIGVKFYGMPAWAWGISPEGIGTVGMVLNAAVTCGVSRATAAPPKSVQALITSLREPGDEPPNNVFLYRTLEEKLELRNAQLDEAYQDIKSLNHRLSGENTDLEELNQQLHTEILERQRAEADLQERTQQLQKAQNEAEVLKG